MYNKVLAAIKKMDDVDIIRVWNEYCYSSKHYDDVIMDCYEIEEMMNNDKGATFNWLNRFYFGNDEGRENTSANPNRNYFVFNGYGNIVSFDYIYNSYSDEFYNIDIEDLVSYIVDNCKSFGFSELDDVLNADCDEE